MTLTTDKQLVALVTGANQGVGNEIAKALAANGYIVYLGSRKLENGEKAAAEIGENARAIQLDVTQEQSIHTAMDRIGKEEGRLDLLVNNAGISHGGTAPIHRMLDIPGPLHPLISLLDTRDEKVNLSRLPVSYVTTLYKISFINKLGGKFRYGQGYYDFDEGSMVFTAPNQIVGSTSIYKGNEGYSLIFHQDFLHGYPLAAKIRQYGFFSYASNEALHLSEQERTTVAAIFSIIQEELSSRIDDFSHDVVIAQIELLLSYAKRFYKRQFLTRQAATSDLLQQFEGLLNTYFYEEKPVMRGIPTVQYLAEQLNYTPNYLSDMLRSLTGLNAQQHIHEKLIEKSKELLSTTSLSVSEVAYQLGFEHSQSFSRLFKIKTQMTPVQFKESLN